MNLSEPLVFAPVYQTVVWGGQRIRTARGEQPEPNESIGESWEVSQQARGMSVVQSGALAGTSLADIMGHDAGGLVGPGFSGREFPLLIKLLDARTRLSVQVHPDDALAQEMGVGTRGKTECWYMIGDGGELFQGTQPGVDASTFRAAIADDTVADQLQVFATNDGDFFHLPARTVHALGNNCMLFEIQQSCDTTYRVYDWGRVGLDGQPRELHIEESMQCIDFDRTTWGPEGGDWQANTAGDGEVRHLVECPYFAVREWRGTQLELAGTKACSILMTVSGEGEVATAGGATGLTALTTVVVPAAAGSARLQADDGATLRVLIAEPRW
jgi:mannose-6-phosphate isomerase